MKINNAPVDAYRQNAGQIPVRKQEELKSNTDSGQVSGLKKITLPEGSVARPAAVKIDRGPSILSSILSSDERNLLVKHFARFGDAPDSTNLYGTDARERDSIETGIRLDLKG